MDFGRVSLKEIIVDMEYKTPKADDPMQVLLSAKNDEKSRFGQTRKTLQSSIESE